MKGPSASRFLQKLLAMLLASLVFASILEGHSAQAFFATPSNHVHMIDGEDETHSEPEPGKMKSSHAHYEDHSHSFGYAPASAASSPLLSIASLWPVTDDRQSSSLPDGLKRPPRTTALR